jgi:ATP-dependent helicase/nuclease subunit B
MPSVVTVLLGPARSGKTTALMSRYRAALASGPPRSTLWIAPTHRSAAQVRERLLLQRPMGAGRAGDGRLTACFSPAVMTFDQFARQVVAAGEQPVQPISHLVKRQLIARLIRGALDAGKLTYFGPIAHTSGLLDLVVALVSELKRLEIWPEEFRRACERRGPHDKDRELAALYETYQQRLTEHHLYDAEGRFWTARELLHRGQRRPFERLRLIVVDGFTDFTRTQHEILEIMAQRVGELLLALPLESGGEREDLFAKSQRTLVQLRERHPGLSVEYLGRPAMAPWPALAHIEADIFKNPRRQRPSSETGGVEVLVAAGPLDELQIVGQRIKRLLLEGDPSASDVHARPGAARPAAKVRPGDVAVVFRSLTAAAPLVREVFDELGLPFALDASRPLSESPALRALVALVQLDEDDWPFRDLLALLTSNFFRPDWPQYQGGRAARSAQFVIRRLQVPAGRVDLIDQTRRWAAHDVGADLSTDGDENANDEGQMRRAHGIEHARRALPLFERLAGALAKLPKQATPGEWGQALARLAAETGLLAAMRANLVRDIADTTQGDIDSDATPAAPDVVDGTTGESTDRAALDCLLGTLSAAEQSAIATGEGPTVLDRAGMLEMVRDILIHDHLPEPHDETGRVRVLSATSARALEIPYLFLAGLSEKAFPPASRDDDLYSEGEYQRLAEAGLPLVLRAERGQEEMLLFYEVVTGATRRLYLSYPGLDDRGNPLLASPYLAEVERASGLKGIEPDLSPVPQGDTPFSPSQQRVMAVAQAFEGSTEILAGLVQSPAMAEVAANVLAGLHVTQQRANDHDFGPFEGMLTSDAARARLAERYGSRRVWSPSHLEQYGRCPHQFFLDRVLGISPLEELSLATDHLTRGARLHDALAEVHRRLNERRGSTSPAREAADDLAELSSDVLAELLRPRPHDTPLIAALKDVDHRLLDGWLQRYLRQFEAYEALWTRLERPLAPAHFEVSFGLSRMSVDPLSTREPLVLTHRGQELRLAGRIDRIDLGQVAGRAVFNVLDYKSGTSARHSKKSIERAEALQLSLYCLAAEELLLADRRAAPWCIGYWFVADSGFPKNQAESLFEESSGELRPTAGWDALRRDVIARVFSLVAGVRGGQFPMINADLHCTSQCDYHTVCRVNQARSLEKTWSPPTTNAT